MRDIVWIPIAALYAVALAGLMVYGLHCYLMIALFLLRQRRQRAANHREVEDYLRDRPPSDFPHVTIQLPIYNEREVVERLIHSVAAIDYPRDRLLVQLLDDSTDDSRDLVERTARAAQEHSGIPFQVIRRDHRHHFKAGALAHGMTLTDSDFIAIFDADFVIPTHFLKRAIALLEPDPILGCVQARWGHLNRLENWLTRAQSVGIDGHFMAEQGARSYHRLCLNFNGTAGIWRRAAIDAAGGWQGDTLTEDLDLSYRAQLAGYHLRYDIDLECPAEIPNTIGAFKSQQRRWAKGSIQTAVKLLPSILRTRRLSLYQKLEAALHLTHYLVSLFMCTLCILTLPMLLWTPLPARNLLLGILWGLIVISAIAPWVMYTGSGIILRRGLFSFLHFPAMLVVGTGVCLNNAHAVIDGLLGRPGDFVRTPKSGSMAGGRRRTSYVVPVNLWLGLVELLLGLYCWYTLGVYLDAQKYLFGFFLAAYACGFSAFGLATLFPARRPAPIHP